MRERILFVIVMAAAQAIADETAEKLKALDATLDSLVKCRKELLEQLDTAQGNADSLTDRLHMVRESWGLTEFPLAVAGGDEPVFGSPILAAEAEFHLSAGDTVEVLETVEDWITVRKGEKKGFARKAHFTIIEGPREKYQKSLEQKE